jgi:hypothetical protein
VSGAATTASLVNVKELFSHLMLIHPAMERPVRSRKLGVVVRAGEKPALTILGHLLYLQILILLRTTGIIKTNFPFIL